VITFAGYLRDLLSNPQKAKEFGRRGQERAQRFTLERMARETLAVYEALVLR